MLMVFFARAETERGLSRKHIIEGMFVGIRGGGDEVILKYNLFLLHNLFE